MRSDVAALPEEFLERLRQIIPGSRWHASANTFTEPRPTTFRVNTLKANTQAIRQKLTDAGFHLEPVSWYSDAFILRRGRLRELQETDCYKNGEIYVQNLSSMIPALVLNPQPEEQVLDLTAAPGSKTTQMACLMKGAGKLIANDCDRIRFYKLRANIQQQAAANVDAQLGFGERFGKTHPESFDRVLVDAPCSAEGRFLVTEPASYRYWKIRKIHEMVGKQRRLIRAAGCSLKPGGVLVYSTCTFAPEENEGIVDFFLRENAEFFELERPNLNLPNAVLGLLSWQKQSFLPATAKTQRILPTPDMEGFFVARLRKTKSQK